MNNPDRPSISELKSIILRLNETLGAPTEYATQAAIYQSNPGHFYLERSNGTYKLNRVANTAGGAVIILFATSKRELRAKLHALLEGIILARNS